MYTFASRSTKVYSIFWSYLDYIPLRFYTLPILLTKSLFDNNIFSEKLSSVESCLGSLLNQRKFTYIHHCEDYFNCWRKVASQARRCKGKLAEPEHRLGAEEDNKVLAQTFKSNKLTSRVLCLLSPFWKTLNYVQQNFAFFSFSVLCWCQLITETKVLSVDALLPRCIIWQIAKNKTPRIRIMVGWRQGFN